MSEDVEAEFESTNTPGYKPTAVKSMDEYKNLDAEDESLARWKASLGLSGDVPAGDTSKPRLTVLYLELESTQLPAGKTIKVDISTPQALEKLEKTPIQVKEGADYKVFVTINVNHGIVTGARYAQVVKRKFMGISKTVDKDNFMLGSYSVQAEPRRVQVVEDEFPSGKVMGVSARGTYNVASRVSDDDGVLANWNWVFEIGKDW